MRQRLPTPNSDDPWAPYVADQATPWDLRRVVHLHRCAGFAATWDELRRDLKDGPEASVGRLLEGKSRSQGVPDDFAEIADRLADLALAAPEPNRLRGWWVYRMLCGPDPLAERLTLMWHDHFATSNLKVNDLSLMCRQNETFTTDAEGRFRVEGFVPGVESVIGIEAPTRPNFRLDAGKALQKLTTGPGEVRDLGDVKVKVQPVE